MLKKTPIYSTNIKVCFQIKMSEMLKTVKLL